MNFDTTESKLGLLCSTNEITKMRFEFLFLSSKKVQVFAYCFVDFAWRLLSWSCSFLRWNDVNNKLGLKRNNNKLIERVIQWQRQHRPCLITAVLRLSRREVFLFSSQHANKKIIKTNSSESQKHKLIYWIHIFTHHKMDFYLLRLCYFHFSVHDNDINTDMEYWSFWSRGWCYNHLFLSFILFVSASFLVLSLRIPFCAIWKPN